MYEWLHEEIARSRMPHFYVVDGPASPEFREAIEKSPWPVPPSYKEFAIQFGNVKLYRIRSEYCVTVYAAPRRIEDHKGVEWAWIGHPRTGMIAFRRDLLNEGKESPVYVWYSNGWQKHADGFEEWIVKQCSYARKKFTKREWKEIENGPAPFTERELAIVAARREYRLRLIGMDAEGHLEIEVYNGSDLMLPHLLIGVKGRRIREHVYGDAHNIYLPISNVLPGETALITTRSSMDYWDPASVELYEVPEPEPALRDVYREFQ